MVWIRLGFGEGKGWGAFNGVGEWGIEGISCMTRACEWYSRPHTAHVAVI